MKGNYKGKSQINKTAEQVGTLSTSQPKSHLRMRKLAIFITCCLEERTSFSIHFMLKLENKNFPSGSLVGLEYSFMIQIFIEHILCTRHCTKTSIWKSRN